MLVPTEPPQTPDRALTLGDTLAPLWPLGYAVLQIWLLRQCLSSTHEAYERQQYLAMGTLFVAAIWAAERWLGARRPWRAGGRVVQGICLVFLTVALSRTLSTWVYVLSVQRRLGAAGMTSVLAWRTDKWRPWELGAAKVLVCSVVSGLFSTFFWWVPWPAFAARGAWVLLAVGLGTACALALFGFSSGATRFRPRRALDICLLSALFAWSWRSNAIGAYHYGFIAGPAELLQDGAQLLWDIPAQYGLLNTWLIAQGPTESPWFNLYALQATLSCAMVAILYLGLARLRNTWCMQLAAAAITAASILLLPGDPATLSGPQGTPTSGALRLVWPYLLVAIAAYGTEGWDGQPAPEPGGRKRALVALVAGSVVWLVALYWSAEVGGWSTVTWWPAAICLIYRVWPAADLGALIRRTLWGLMGLSGLAMASILGVTSLYAWRMGHLPDWWAYVDFVRAYGTGFGALDIHPRGGVWALLLLHALAVWVCVQAWSAMGLRRLPPVLIAATASFWACCSYFISRSHESNVTALMPIGALLGMVLWRYTRLQALPERVRRVVPLYVAPLFCVIVAIGYHNSDALVGTTPGFLAGAKKLRAGSSAQPEPALVALLKAAPITCDDAVSYVGPEDPGHMPRTLCRDGATMTHGVQRRYRQWLPLHPASVMRALPRPRQEAYMTRYLARQTQRGGWLIDYKPTAFQQDPWIAQFVAANFEVAETHENATYRARRFRARDAP